MSRRWEMGKSAMGRFEEYVSLIAQQLGHADRVEPFRGYCTGLLLPVQRKSVEPMAAHLAPARVSSEHQRLHHFVADAAWSDDAVFAAVRDYVLERVVPRAGSPEALLIDDTGFPKQGRHSVGVARQYCGQLGKQDNCQVAVSISLANEAFSLPVAYRLYLPQEWAEDAARRRTAKVPQTVQFTTKPMLALQALEQLRASAAALPELVVADAGYGINTSFRERLTELGFAYVVGITGALSLWPEGRAPLPPKAWSGRGRKPKLLQRDAQHKPLPAKALAMQLPARRFRTVTWREGTNATLSSRFAALAGALRSSRLLAHRASSRAMAAHRMAQRRSRTHQVFLEHLARRHPAQGVGALGEAALAYRARLPGTQTGAWPRPLRGPQLARLSPSRNPVHSRLRLPARATNCGSKKNSASSDFRRSACLTRGLPAPRLPCEGSDT
jgi:SRSO17 transposase